MELLDFHSQKLKLDFLSFSTPYFENDQKVKNLTNYFYQILGFNSFLSQGNQRKIIQTLFLDKRTKDTLIVRINYWNQLVLEFPGQSANKLYQLLKSNAIDWYSFEFNDLRLSRLDIYYEQTKSHSFKSDEFDQFLLNTRKHLLLETRTETIKLINSLKGRILGINKRSNSRYFRVYENSNRIRFELELKKSSLNNFQGQFFNSQFDLFPLDSFFVRWLIDFHRKHIIHQNNSNLVLVTDYFKNPNKFTQSQYDERLFHLIQFLTFIQTLNHQNCPLHFVEGKKYIVQEFYLVDFMKFFSISTKSTKAREKLLNYFELLHQADPIVEQFADGQFRIFATFLFSGVEKVKNRWIVKVYIIEDLDHYFYPFIFSKSFFNYKNKTDCFLKLKIIRNISRPGLKKLFPFALFIQELNLSSSKILEVKKDFIQLIREICGEGIIQNNIEIISKHKNYPIQKLTINQLKVNDLNHRVAFVIFYEIIQ